MKVRASESLMKLISDIKQYLILNDFPSVNEAISDNSKRFLELEVWKAPLTFSITTISNVESYSVQSMSYKLRNVLPNNVGQRKMV